MIDQLTELYMSFCTFADPPSYLENPAIFENDAVQIRCLVLAVDRRGRKSEVRMAVARAGDASNILQTRAFPHPVACSAASRACLQKLIVIVGATFRMRLHLTSRL